MQPDPIGRAVAAPGPGGAQDTFDVIGESLGEVRLAHCGQPDLPPFWAWRTGWAELHIWDQEPDPYRVLHPAADLPRCPFAVGSSTDVRGWRIIRYPAQGCRSPHRWQLGYVPTEHMALHVGAHAHRIVAAQGTEDYIGLEAVTLDGYFRAYTFTAEGATATEALKQRVNASRHPG